MKFIKNMDKRVKKLDLFDIGMIKWTTLLVGLVVGAYLTDYIKPYWWVFILVAMVLAIRPMYRYFLMLLKK